MGGVWQLLKTSSKTRLRGPYLRLRHVLSRLAPGRLARTLGWHLGVYAACRRRRREPRFTVGVDISCLWEPLTGIGWYLYLVLAHLAERDDVRLRLYGPHLPAWEPVPEPVVEPPRGRAIERVVHPVVGDLSVADWKLHEWLCDRAPELVAKDGNQVLFAPNYLPPPLFARGSGALVVTVHDLGFRRVPWALKAETLEQLTADLEATLARAAHVLTPSETVRAEIVEAGDAGPERVTAVHHGPGLGGPAPADTPLPAGVPQRYVLHVGTLEPRKNVGVLLEAWKLLRSEGPEPPPLVLCGRFGWKAEELRAEVERGREEGWLVHLGYVEEAELTALYRHARLVVFPSLYEGFGLPAVEAQKAGTPLVASDIPVLHEVAGEGALYAPPEKPEAWAERVREVTENAALARDLRARGLANVERFSWERAAEQILEVWRRAART